MFVFRGAGRLRVPHRITLIPDSVNAGVGRVAKNQEELPVPEALLILAAVYNTGLKRNQSAAFEAHDTL